MDEDFLSWLLLIPGVGRRRAELLAERYPSVDALRAAPIEDLAAIEGIGPLLAQRIREFAERAAPGSDFWYRGEAALYLCPECGALIAKDAKACPFCNTVFEGEVAGEEAEIPELEPRTDVLQPEGQALSLCPQCGAFVGADDEVCPRCGIRLEGEAEPEAAPEGVEAGADVLQPEGQGLYLCPSCGAMVGGTAERCPKCGAILEGEEAPPPVAAEEVAELPPEAIASEPSLFLCTNCGAFLRPQDTRCPSCGVEFEEGEIAAETLAPEEEGAVFPICPNCGALVPSTVRKCVICGHRMGEPVAKPAEVPEEEIGITKDFLERWKRVAEEKVSPQAQLLRELEQYEQILAADPTVERAWLRKAGVLLKLGRVREAIACYEKLAELDPSREEEYRLEVLNLAETHADLSLLPRRWSAVAATEPAPEIAPREEPAEVPVRPEAARVLEALDFYEKLLAVDPTLIAAWRTKGELLERLGRTAEAEAARGRADELSRPRREVLPGLRTVGPRPTPRMEGRVNGVLGRTNGRINGTGRVNGMGRVNGTGRINGTGRGRVNGLVAPAGRTNGLTSGVAPGEGMVNGLINGNGFTNGRRGRWTPRPDTPRSWMRSVAGIAAVVLILMFTPIIATFISSSPLPGGIAIDGKFADWGDAPVYVDEFGDAAANPDVNLLSYRAKVADGTLLLYASVEGTFFGARAGGGDSLYVFVDEDGNPGTGYRIGALGAERAVELYGWDGAFKGSTVWTYNPNVGGASSDDWRSFDPTGTARAAGLGAELEASVPLGDAMDPNRVRILLHTLDRAGNGDPADGVIGSGDGALVVTQRTIGADVVSGTLVPFLHVQLRALADSVTVASITVAKTGSLPDGDVTASLYLDANGNGLLDGPDTLLATEPFAPDATFALDRTVPASEMYLLAANLLVPSPNASVGFRVVAASATAPVTLRDAGLSMAYVDGPPLAVVADGAFADWNRFALRVDGDDDVRTQTLNATVNENIDLRAYEAVVSANVSLYMRVDGRILGGVDIPNFRDRPTPIVLVDTDGDTVPDEVERALGATLPFDFNNDNVTDANEPEDVDGDGLLDYNKCFAADCSAYTDYVLETAIPAWYPAPYAGTVVRKYIGPVSLSPKRGVDTALVYVDRDNRTDTGLLVHVDGVPYGMDFAYQAVGRGGAILESALFVYNGTRPIPWERIADVATAVDDRQLETSFDAALLNLAANHTFLFFTTDWQFSFDDAGSGTGIRRAPGPWTRSLDGTGVVINEISPQPNPEWLELANPGSSSVNLNGWVLQRKQGNKWTTLYTFTQTIGAWGSGTEYLGVDFAPNTLPNGQVTLRLVSANGTVVDETTYPNAGAGKSWARFKHPTTGKPADTDNDGSDFYISTSPTKGGPNDRHRPRIVVAKVANKAFAAPGDTITYTVYYNNTDTGRANRVWVNDTLPVGVTFVSSSVAPDSSSGRTYRWVFTNVNPITPNSFTITVRVNGTAGSNQVLRNTAGLNYTDQLNRKLEPSVATANTTVRRPVITVQKIADKSDALPGDTITYTVFYNNTGSAVANHVWLNDTLPVGVTYQSASPPPGSISGQTLRWHFTNVAVGSHSVTITVTVDANPPQVLVNWAFLNYTAQNNFKLESSSASAFTAIPEYEVLVLPIAIPLALYGLRRFRRREEG